MMMNSSMPHAFSDIPDPRMPTLNMRHKFIDILTIGLCGIIAGAEDWEAIHEFAMAKEDWLSTFLELPNGIPSRSVLSRVFRQMDSQMFEKSFMRWTAGIAASVTGVVSIDGKTVRGSRDLPQDQKAIHMVSAWASEANLILGQVKTEEKSNEITAIPELLNLLALSGCLITIDAMGCQKGIAAIIGEHGSDYLLQVKDNQPKLREAIHSAFHHSDDQLFSSYFSAPVELTNSGHGREEKRICWVSETLEFVTVAQDWPGLKRVVVVESERIVAGKTSLEHRFYITSDAVRTPEQLLEATRAHWGIESMHWMLDVCFNEDSCQVKKDHGPENLSILRRIALNLVKKDKWKRLGVKNSCRVAGWNQDYMARLLGGLLSL